MLQTSSSLQGLVPQRHCKARCFKPASASNESFRKGSVKQNASNQLQPPIKLFLRDLYRRTPILRMVPLFITSKCPCGSWQWTMLWKRLRWRLDLVWGIPCYKSFKKSLTTGWSWFEAVAFADYRKKQFHWRLELASSIFLYKSLKKISKQNYL